MMNPDIARVIRCADFYRRRGYQPLPSRSDGRAPALLSYAELWDSPLSKEAFDAQATLNIQLMCGVRWNLIVVDLDGEAARKAFIHLWSTNGETKFTWEVQTPSGGRHLWFRPRIDRASCASGRIWGLWDTAGGKEGTGGWMPHTGIEILGDKHLVTVPPSRRGRPYRWVDGLSPRQLPEPAILPAWIDDMPRLPQKLPLVPPPGRCLVGPEGVHGELPGPPPGGGTKGSSATWDGVRYGREDVIAAIHRSKAMIGVAKGFGITFFREETNNAGWCPCYARSNSGVPGRSDGDCHPSASFHPATGVYLEHYDRQPISLFDLGVLAGFRSDWRDVCNALGAEYGATPLP